MKHSSRCAPLANKTIARLSSVLELTGAAKLGLQSNESNAQSPTAHVSLTMKRLPSKSMKQKGEEDALETETWKA